MIDTTVATFGRLDAAFSNAGIQVPGEAIRPLAQFRVPGNPFPAQRRHLDEREAARDGPLTWNSGGEAGSGGMGTR